MELYVTLDKPVTVSNVSYSPGSKVPLQAALDSGAITQDDVDGATRAGAIIAAQEAPENATVPGRKTRAKTPRQQTRAKPVASPAKAEHDRKAAETQKARKRA